MRCWWWRSEYTFNSGMGQNKDWSIFVCKLLRYGGGCDKITKSACDTYWRKWIMIPPFYGPLSNGHSLSDGRMDRWWWHNRDMYEEMSKLNILFGSGSVVRGSEQEQRDRVKLHWKFEGCRLWKGQIDMCIQLLTSMYSRTAHTGRYTLVGNCCVVQWKFFVCQWECCGQLCYLCCVQGHFKWWGYLGTCSVNKNKRV